MTTMLDEDQHAKNLGANCPVCGSDELDGSSVETGSGMATQEMACIDCDSTWLDEYQLISYADLENRAK
jgi:transposase-like protein